MDEREENKELPEPAILEQEAIGELEAAIAELQGILQELGEDISL
jgi:type I restriction enzyme M protein